MAGEEMTKGGSCESACAGAVLKVWMGLGRVSPIRWCVAGDSAQREL